MHPAAAEELRNWPTLDFAAVARDHNVTLTETELHELERGDIVSLNSQYPTVWNIKSRGACPNQTPEMQVNCCVYLFVPLYTNAHVRTGLLPAAVCHRVRQDQDDAETRFLPADDEVMSHLSQSHRQSSQDPGGDEG